MRKVASEDNDNCEWRGSAPSPRGSTNLGRRRRLPWLVALLIAMSMATACNATGSQENGGSSAGKKTLIIGTALEPASLHILRDGDDGNELVNWSINEPLVDRTSDGLVPVLATELPTHDKSDPNRWHVKLRKGVTFTNGEPFNADVVKENIDMIVNPKFGATINGFETLKTAQVIDEYDVDLITIQPDPYLLYRLATIRFVPPKASADADAYSQHPIGTGPYKFAEWDKGQRIVLVKNDNYWGGSGAQLDKVEFRFIPEEAARIAALNAGEVDMITGIAPDEVKQVPQVLRSDGYGRTSVLRFNLEMPPFDDPKFRQALEYAIDRNSLNKNLFAGQDHVSQCQVLPPGEFGFNDSLHAYPYDPEKAKELLSQVNLPSGSGSRWRQRPVATKRRTTKSGKPLRPIGRRSD